MSSSLKSGKICIVHSLAFLGAILHILGIFMVKFHYKNVIKSVVAYLVKTWWHVINYKVYSLWTYVCQIWQSEIINARAWERLGWIKCHSVSDPRTLTKKNMLNEQNLWIYRSPIDKPITLCNLIGILKMEMRHKLNIVGVYEKMKSNKR